MTFDERVRALEPFGFTPRQTRFLVDRRAAQRLLPAPAVHGVRRAAVRQERPRLSRHAGRAPARRARSRAERIAAHSTTCTRGRSTARCGRTTTATAAHASAALIARKLMVLDFVLAHADARVAARPRRTRSSCSPSASASRWRDLPQQRLRGVRPADGADRRGTSPTSCPICRGGRSAGRALRVLWPLDAARPGLRAVPARPRAAARPAAGLDRRRGRPDVRRGLAGLRGRRSTRYLRSRRRRVATTAPTTSRWYFVDAPGGRAGRPGARCRWPTSIAFATLRRAVRRRRRSRRCMREWLTSRRRARSTARRGADAAAPRAASGSS